MTNSNPLAVNPTPAATIAAIGTAQSGDTIVLPDGDIHVSSSIVLSDVDDTIIRGGKQTRIIYDGPPTVGAIQFRRTSRCRLENVDTVIASNGVDAAVLVTNLPGVSPFGRVTTACTFDRVRVSHAGLANSPMRAFSVDSFAIGGIDNNNEHHRFLQCIAGVYSESGFHISGSQAHGLMFDSCAAYDTNRVGKYGVFGQYGCFFDWRNGAMSFNECDFFLNNFLIRVCVDGHNSENAKQLMRFGSTGSQSSTILRNVRWDGNPDPALPLVQAWTLGPITVENMVVLSMNGVMPQVAISCYQKQVGIPPHLVRMFGTAVVRNNCFTVQNPNAAAKTTPSIIVPKNWYTDVKLNSVIFQDATGQQEGPALVSKVD